MHSEKLFIYSPSHPAFNLSGVVSTASSFILRAVAFEVLMSGPMSDNVWTSVEHSINRDRQRQGKGKAIPVTGSGGP
jgi:hypothetical protein